MAGADEKQNKGGTVMALKALMLRKKIDVKKKELEALRSAAEELQTREAELETAIAEASTEEEQTAVSEAIDQFNTDRAANAAAVESLEKEISELEADLEAEEREQVVDPVEEREREEKVHTPETRNRFGLTAEMVARDEVKSFLAEVRSCISEKRALSNVGLTIPQVYLGLIKENVIDYSKLYKHVFVRQLKGEGKLTIMGTIPQAVWTACCGNINEMTLGFNEVTVDCNKVAAFFLRNFGFFNWPLLIIACSISSHL